MKRLKLYWKDAMLTLGLLLTAFILSLLIEHWIGTKSQTPMVFVLGVFLVSVMTQGYFWGIAASLLSVLLVNYAFTYPYYAIDLISPECVGAAIVMLIVACVTGTLTTKLKIQERIKAEIDKERMRANLLRAVSHDLRTPLTSICGASAVIMENYHSLTEEQQMRLLGEVREDAEWLTRMVENLLSVTRIDGEKVKVQKVATVLEELVDTVLVKFRKHCPGQAVQVSLPDRFVSIPMDPILIEQVLINILENAVYHAAGMKRLELTVTCSGGKALFRVTDDGCGIPADRMRNLFTGYLDREEVPVDSSRNNMGIGLSVCASIVKAHGSEIYAENRPEGGAAFWFALEMEDGTAYEQV